MGCLKRQRKDDQNQFPIWRIANRECSEFQGNNTIFTYNLTSIFTSGRYA
jgi:hypothetical protein